MATLAALFQGGVATWSLGEFLIAIVLIVGGVAVVFIVTKAMGIVIPPWIIQLAWVLVAVVIGVLALRFIFSL